MRVPPSYHIREIHTIRLETAYSARSKWHEFGIHFSSTPFIDASSLLTQISLRKWSNNTVYSVIQQSHSFSSTIVMLSPSFIQTNYNTPTGESPHNLSAFTTSTVTYDENTPPLKRGDASGGTREVHCTWCNTYVKHGQERHTRSALYKHQKGSKCRLQLIGEL